MNEYSNDINNIYHTYRIESLNLSTQLTYMKLLQRSKGT